MSIYDLFKRHDRNCAALRREKVAEARQRIDDGFYEQPEVVDFAMTRLLDVLTDDAPETLADQYRLAHREDQQLDPQALRAREAAERIVDTKRPAVQCEVLAERWDGLS